MFRPFLIVSIVMFTFLNHSISQETVEEITDKFFMLYETKGPEKAVDYVFSTNKWIKSKPDAVNQIKGKLVKAVELVGDYHGYELVTKKNIGNSYKLLSYMLKYDRQPIQFTFILYKPKEIWQIQNLQFDDKFVDDLKEIENLINQE